MASTSCLPSPADWVISAAACWLTSASLLTSEATTANPLPCSPARAASTEAFRANRSVSRVISSTTRIFSAMPRMASAVRCMAWALRLASSAARVAIFSVSSALVAFCWMPAAICSMAAEVCSTELAWLLLPMEICRAALRNSLLPAATSAATRWIWSTIWRRFSSICRTACPSVSRSDSTAGSTVKSPWAMVSATLAMVARDSTARLSATAMRPTSSWLSTVTRWVRSPIATASRTCAVSLNGVAISRAVTQPMIRANSNPASASTSIVFQLQV